MITKLRFSYQYSLLTLSKLKHLHFSVLDSLSLQAQASSLVLITFVNNFQFNLVLMFAFFVNNSLVVNSI